jgi:hypothetical protein
LRFGNAQGLGFFFQPVIQVLFGFEGDSSHGQKVIPGCSIGNTHCVEQENLARYGKVTEKTATSITLKVKRDRVIPVCKSLLDELPVTDIDIQEVPIEDVIRQIFAR